MRDSFKNLLITVSAVASMMVISCTREACFDETNALLKASLYLDSLQTITAPDSLTLYGLGMDTSKIYNKSAFIKQALIPLNSSEAGCRFIVRINGVSDTLSLWYTSFPHLVSQVCGYTFYHTLDSVAVTNNIIDTIKVTTNSVTTLNGENIRIYY